MKIKKTNLRQMVQEELENIIIEQEIKKVASPDQRLNEGWLQDMAAGVATAFGKIKGAVTSIGGWEKALTDETASDKLGEKSSDTMAKFVKDTIGDKNTTNVGINTWQLESTPPAGPPPASPTPLWRILKSGLSTTSHAFQFFDPTPQASGAHRTRLVINDKTGLTIDMSEWFETKFDDTYGAGCSLMLLTAQAYLALNVLTDAFETDQTYTTPAGTSDAVEMAANAPAGQYSVRALRDALAKRLDKNEDHVALVAYANDDNNFRNEDNKKQFNNLLKQAIYDRNRFLMRWFKAEMERKQEDPDYEFANPIYLRDLGKLGGEYSAFKPAWGNLKLGDSKAPRGRRKTDFKVGVGSGSDFQPAIKRLWDAIHGAEGRFPVTAVTAERTSTEMLGLISKYLHASYGSGTRESDYLGESAKIFDAYMTALTGVNLDGAESVLDPEDFNYVSNEQFLANISDKDKRTLQLIRKEILGGLKVVTKKIDDEWQRQENTGAGPMYPRGAPTPPPAAQPRRPKAVTPGASPKPPVAAPTGPTSLTRRGPGDVATRESMGSGVSKDRLQQIIAEEVERVKAERSRRS